ncbi:MAG: winged helix-turn-helix transcriptional regulator [Alphaproteobacteria bacterium]|nr:winged helix-turn-helix transcriptional regulator [Alphaproteobacteria bacterium]
MQAGELAGVLGALGQETRLQIIRILAPLSKGKAPVGLAAGQIAAALGVSPPTLSFHLKDLALRKLVVQKRRGRELIYFANLALILAALGEFVGELEI